MILWEKRRRIYVPDGSLTWMGHARFAAGYRPAR